MFFSLTAALIATYPRQYSRCWSYVCTFDPHHQPFEADANVVAFSQVRNLQHQAARSLFHCYPAVKSQTQNVHWQCSCSSRHSHHRALRGCLHFWMLSHRFQWEENCILRSWHKDFSQGGKSPYSLTPTLNTHTHTRAPPHTGAGALRTGNDLKTKWSMFSTVPLPLTFHSKCVLHTNGRWEQSRVTHGWLAFVSEPTSSPRGAKSGKDNSGPTWDLHFHFFIVSLFMQIR